MFGFDGFLRRLSDDLVIEDYEQVDVEREQCDDEETDDDDGDDDHDRQHDEEHRVLDHCVSRTYDSRFR